MNQKGRASLQRIWLEDLTERVLRPNSFEPRPFLRWAGSKRAVLRHVVRVLPRSYNTYFEPFLGAASLFFLLEPQKAVLSDACKELVDAFVAVRDNVASTIRYLRPMRPDRDEFYRIRAKRSPGRFKRAAEFIYLNKTCWNGLYRVNSDGQFNVPFGLPKSDVIADLANLRACARALRVDGVILKSCDFEESLACAGAGDLVYLDPPYVTRHNNNGFIDYNERLFSWKDQERLAAIATRLAKKGAKVVITNANHKEILELYSSFERFEFDRASTLASDARSRGRVSEVLLSSTTQT